MIYRLHGETPNHVRELREPGLVYQPGSLLEVRASQIVDAAYQVHRLLGPGLLESAYQNALIIELTDRGMDVRSEVPVPLIYRGREIGTAYRADMIVENSIVVENKTVERIAPIHEAQLLTYLRLTKLHVGFIINWNTKRFRDGIKRMVFDYEGPKSSNQRG